jgi:hypothetical protein
MWFNGLTGKRNYSLAFDGTDDYVSTSTTLDLSKTSAITVSMWLNWTVFAGNDKLAMEFTTDTNSFTTGFYVDPNSANGTFPNSFSVALQGNVGLNSALFTRPSAGAWHHYVFVLDKGALAASEITPFVDGRVQSYNKAQSSENTNNFGNATLYFMSRAGSSLFGAGQIDDVRVYNYALTAGQVKLLYNNGAINFGPVIGAP